MAQVAAEETNKAGSSKLAPSTMRTWRTLSKKIKGTGRKIQYFLYEPSLFLPSYSAGELVFVYQEAGKPFERANILTKVNINPISKWCGRCTLKYCGGSRSTYNVRPKNMVKVIETSSVDMRKVIVTSTTHMYRRLAHSQTFQQDIALEIGCDFGPTTKVLGEKCLHAIGVDKAWPHIQHAIEANHAENVHFHCVDIFENPKNILGKYKDLGSPSIVFIDINGNRELEAVEDAIDLVEKLITPRLIVVKSVSLFSSLMYEGGEMVEVGPVYFM